MAQINLIIKQKNTEVEQVSSDMIDKLYNLAYEDEITEPKVNSTENDIVGNINAPVAYEDAVTFLRSKFPNLVISVTDNNYYIRFEDDNVLQVLLNASVGNGIGITTGNVQSYKINQLFYNNTDIKYFDELKYFTAQNNSGFSSWGAFRDCTSLERVDISNLQTFASGNTFSGCTNLEYLYGKNSIKGEVNLVNYTNSTIPADTFSGCTSLTKIKSLGNTSTIGNFAFARCTGLTEISQDVLDNLEVIEYSAFEGCSNLVIDELSLPNLVSLGNYGGTFSGTQIKKIINLGNAAVVTGFSGCKSLTEVTLPDSCIELAGKAFEECSNLTTINLQNVQKMSTSNLFSCTSLEYFGGPDSEKGIFDFPNLVSGELGLTGTKVKEVRSCGGITKLGGWGFIDCSSLTTIYPSVFEQMTEIGAMAFWRCPSLVINDLYCPNLTSIGQSAFPGIKIKKISSLGTITLLPFDNFQNCTLLTEVTLPATLTNIERNVFSGCTALTSFTILAETPPTIDTSALTNTNNCPIYVPSASVEAYKVAPGWSDYANRIQAITE